MEQAQDESAALANQLLRRIMNGGDAHRQAVAKLFRCFAPRFRRYFRSQHLGDAEAEDLVQDVFVKVVRACGDFRGIARADTWLWATARNSLISRFPARLPDMPLDDLDQLVVIDTCHAGGLDGTVRGLYDARFGVLARRMGLHVLASASATEEAIDGYQGSGLFTHAMLRAMDDPASDDNKDRRLSATELGRYARELTQRIACGMRFSQTPLSFHFGRDLVIAVFP